MRIALVVSRYHAFVTEPLEAGARAALAEAGVAASDIETFAVPGAYELAQAAQRVAESGRWSAVVCLGCLIRGETPHFDYIASEAASGLQLAAIETGIPVSFGVLTVENIAQGEARLERAADAVRSALEMADLFAQLRVSARTG